MRHEIQKQSSASRALHVLLVEPNPIIRWVHRITLETVGYNVLEAGDGATALQVAAVEAPDLLLLSLRLGDMDATHLARQMRGRLGRGFPILAYAEEQTAVRASKKHRQDFTGFLIRPFLPSGLVLTIQLHLRDKLVDRQQPVRVQRARLSQETYSDKARKLEHLRTGQRVLIVDDNVNDREELKDRLTDVGFEVVAVADGAAAANHALENRFDAIATDTVMPRMDGFELCLMIRLIYQLALVPILMTPAGHIEEVDRAIAYALGANAVVSRRPDFHKVVDSLRTILAEEPPPLSREPSALPADRRELLLGYGDNQPRQ